jgi:energy-coupling factor transporter ATP-binding protein EcfA2
MLPEQQNPLALTAMTLRGIGSYLHGARLEFRPLTILCGKNGSGKSTWLKALNVLSKSLEAGKLPFGFDVADSATGGIQLENAFYHLATPEDHSRIADPDATRQFGPPSTIGLEFEAVQSRSLSHTEGNANLLSGMAQRFLWLGQCEAGTRFRVRLAHPSYCRDGMATPELYHLIELQLNDTFVVQMKGERDPLQTFEGGCSRPRRSRPYELSLSAAFLPGWKHNDNDILPLATVAELPILQCVPHLDHPQVKLAADRLNDAGELSRLAAGVVEYLDIRIRQLLELVLGGYFYIGAIRQPTTGVEIPRVKPEKEEQSTTILQRRHVGDSGQYAWLMERHFKKCKMRQHELREFHPDDFTPTACNAFFTPECRKENEKLSRMWELAAPEPKRQMTRLIEHYFKYVEKDLDDAEEKKWEQYLKPRMAQWTASLLNSLLDRRDLFASCWCGSDIENDHEIDYYAHRGIASLSPHELRRFNVLLIEEALPNKWWNPSTLKYGHSTVSFEEYVSFWTNRLVEVGISRDSTRKSPHSQMSPAHRLLEDRLPTGFLLDPDSFERDLSDEDEDRRLQRVIHPCFGSDHGGALQPPRQMSAGFHQVFPIIVQLGLMKLGDILGIENPGVHLHPSLQLQFTEAMIRHAATGRTIVIETHSDLVIRRTIRAILEEDIAQASVHVYFTDLTEEVGASIDGEETAFRRSIISPICVDERGRISNWPSGFLDDDVRESQRLLGIMYGGPDSGDDDDD